MIVRILGDGQYRVPDDMAARIAAIDMLIDADLLAGDPDAFRAHITALTAAVREEGTPLGADMLTTSDIILPPPDITLDELQALLAATPPATPSGGTDG